MKKTVSLLLVFSLLVYGIILLNPPVLTRAAGSFHLVISEIKITGGSGKSTDEFAEIYNPSENDISLSGWQLIKKTTSGNEYILVDDFGNKEIKAHSFFLIVHPAGYLSEVPPDFYYTTTNSIASNNTVVLLDNEGKEVDRVGMGTASDFEGEAVGNPGSNKSIERKAQSNSTEETMVEGGTHYFLGNSEDTDNNAQDFVLRLEPEPQNSLSEPEYLGIEIPEIPEPSVGEPEESTPPSSESEPEQEAPSESEIIYSDKIIITELLPNPEGKDDREFIELYNSDSKDIDLEGWKLGDNSTHKYTIKKDDFDSTLIAAGDYFVIDKEISGISLNNTADSAKLYHPDATLVDSVGYEECKEAQSYNLIDSEWIWSDEPTPGHENRFVIKNKLPSASFELEDEEFKVGQTIIFDASDSSDPDNDDLEFIWDFGNGEQASGEKVEYVYRKEGTYPVTLLVKDEKGGEDETETEVTISDYDYSDKIVLSELLPACSGSDQECEFIELYNPEDRDVNLEGWQLTDLKSYYKFSEDNLIQSKSYLLIERKDSKITLNNSGEKIFLIDPAGKVINGVEYGKATKDLSFARDLDSQKWQWTEKPTPGEENEFILLEDKEELEELKGDKIRSKEVGVATVNNEPLEIGIGEVNEDFLGKLLKIEGELESKRSPSYYLMDELGNILRMYIQKKTNIPKLDVGVGDMMEVVGVLDKTSTGLRLLPRTQEDIVIIPKKKAEQGQEGKVLGASVEREEINVPIKDKSKQVKLYLYIGVGTLVVALIGVGAKLYLKKRKEEEDINV